MKNGINSRLLKELFERRSVMQGAELYERFFPMIWPCENNFVEFLKAEESSVKLSFAKKIYDYERAEEEVFLPEFSINELIKVQQTNITKHESEHIAQDHVIHCINLYVLGIYLFFNVPIFQRKLIPSYIEKYDSTLSADYEFIDFLKKWKAFALYHDVGYVFEALTSNAKEKEMNYDFSKYNHLCQYFLHDCVCRSVARTILAAFLLAQSSSSFDITMLNFQNGNWQNINGEILQEIEIREKLEDFRGFKKIENIFSPFGLRHVLPFIKNDPMLILVMDKTNNLASIIISKPNSEPTILKNNDTIERKTLQLIAEHVPICSKNFTCFYFSREPNQSIKKMYYENECSPFGDEVMSYPKALPQTLRTKLSLLFDDNSADSAYYELFTWIQDYFSEVYPTTEIADIIRKKQDYYYKSVLLTYIIKEIKRHLNDKIITSVDLASEVSKLSEQIKNISINKIVDDSTSLYDMEEGITGTILEYFCFLQKGLNQVLDFLKNESLVTTSDNDDFAINGFPTDNEWKKQLYSTLDFYANGLGLDLDDMIKYKPSYSLFDHGVVSAALLYQIVAFCGCFSKESVSKCFKPIQASWDNFESLFSPSNRELQKYADVVFSILIHNIYTKKVQPTYGLEYTQDINENPFCYFCALMDLLQKWNRPKQIDFSLLDLPEDHFLNGEYDIEVLNGKIFIVYSTYTSGVMREELNNAEAYLPGITELVKVEEKSISAQDTHAPFQNISYYYN